MRRSAARRREDVRRLLRAAQSTYERRATLTDRIALSTGLSRAGVELGFESLERDATDVELDALEASVPPASSVHVVLSANVFVAPLRALALARAAAPRVTVRPSPRDPWLARALVEAAADPDLTLTDDRDVARIEAESFHVYGRDETIEAVRRAAEGRAVWGHGAGMGAACLTRGAGVPGAADLVARDVVAFDQRGCLSPRIVFVEGDAPRGEAFARALHEALAAWEQHVPRGSLTPDELARARRWIDGATVAGPTWASQDHAVALFDWRSPFALPPPGRHVHVGAVGSPDEARRALASLGRSLVAVGTDDARAIAGAAPLARVAAVGRMQRPPLDGPVDRR
jgi:hypothetical protein